MKIARHNIKEKLKFYLWLVSNGCDVKNFDPANLQIHEMPERRKSSFKKRSQYIKETYNHKFCFKVENGWQKNISKEDLSILDYSTPKKKLTKPL